MYLTNRSCSFSLPFLFPSPVFKKSLREKIGIGRMHKTTDAVPQWREDESIDLEAQEEGAEKYGNDGRVDASAEDEGTDEEISYRQKQAAAPRQEDPAAPLTTTTEHKKKEYPTTEHAIRTLALHTGAETVSFCKPLT
jgi:hypothetical protein